MVQILKIHTNDGNKSQLNNSSSTAAFTAASVTESPSPARLRASQNARVQKMGNKDVTDASGWYTLYIILHWHYFTFILPWHDFKSVFSYRHIAAGSAWFVLAPLWQWLGYQGLEVSPLKSSPRSVEIGRDRSKQKEPRPEFVATFMAKIHDIWGTVKICCWTEVRH